MKLIKKILQNDLVELSIVSILALLICLLYISTTGQKTTRARELYLEAYGENSVGNKDRALELLYESNSQWESKDTWKLIEEISVNR